ncbi:MAG: S8 family serine peptidase [Bacteriovoracaceae bacterium]
MFKRSLFLIFILTLSSCFKKEKSISTIQEHDQNENVKDELVVSHEISLTQLKSDILALSIPSPLSTSTLQSQLKNKKFIYNNQLLDLSKERERLKSNKGEKDKAFRKLFTLLENDIRVLTEKSKAARGQLAQNLSKSIDNKTRQIKLNNELNDIEQTIYERKLLSFNHQKDVINQKRVILKSDLDKRIDTLNSYNDSIEEIQELRKNQLLLLEGLENSDKNALSKKLLAINEDIKIMIKEAKETKSESLDEIESVLIKERFKLSQLEKKRITSEEQETNYKKIKRSLEILVLRYAALEKQRNNIPPEPEPEAEPVPASPTEIITEPDPQEVEDERRINKLSQFKTGDDPLFTYQWHIKNDGQTSFSRKRALFGKDIGPGDVYKRGFSGLGIKIAVSDTGLETQHEDIAPNIITGSRDYDRGERDEDYLGEPLPKGRSHGTSVSGIIASRGWNEIGGRGVAPMAKIVGFNFIGSPRSRYEYIHQTKGPFDIFNYSYGKNPCSFHKVSPSFEKSLKKNVLTLRNGLGPLYVKSAGNEFKDKASSCNDKYEHTYYGNSAIIGDNSLPYFIVTGAVNSNGLKSSYSSPGPNLWVSAPGGEYGQIYPAILTTDLSGCDEGSSTKTNRPKNYFEYGSSLNRDCNYTSTMNGTSAAAPIISGVIAIILEANPKLSWRDVKHIIALSSTKIDKSGPKEHPGSQDLPRHTYLDGWIKNSAGFSFHNWYGFGLINLEKAVKLAQNYKFTLGDFIETSNPNNKEWYYSSGYEGASIPDFSSAGTTSSIDVQHKMKIEAIQVKLNIKHNYPSDLGVELYSPSGTKSILMHINSGIINRSIENEVILTNAFYGENTFGTWTLKLIDGSKSYTGELKDWEIKFFGHRDHKSKEVRINYNPQIDVDTDGWSNSKSINIEWNHFQSSLRYELSVGSKANQDDLIKWFSAGNKKSSSISLKDFHKKIYTNKSYYLNLRIIDQNENRSQIFSKKWILKK